MGFKKFAKHVLNKASRELSPEAFKKRKEAEYERRKENVKHLKLKAEEAKLNATIANANIKRKKKANFGTGGTPKDPSKMDWSFKW